MHVCEHFGKETGLRRIALAGGVALNCTANGKLMRSASFDEVYVQPVAGDDGVALGAALYRTSLAQKLPNRASPLRCLARSTTRTTLRPRCSASTARSSGSASTRSKKPAPRRPSSLPTAA